MDWPPRVAVEVRQGTLGSDDRGWPGKETLRWSVEVRHKTLDVAARGCCGGEGGGGETSDSTFCSALHLSIVSEV